MRPLKRTTVTRGLALAAASAFAALGTVLVSSAPAEAACNGQANGYTITRYHGSTAVAQERQVTGTCDGNGYYSGQLRDMVQGDGFTAKVRFKEGSFNEVVFLTGSITWQGYTYTEKTPDSATSYASMQVYTDPDRRPDLYSVNTGF
ncbi:hypothetical protein GCM10009830_29560 [Glycomyces endophyticus]|uniref:Secreted protein n=1 Tax=Glycomyces endophyticus TaxID=480996 RepID=A0ABP4T2G5_9ACTN